MGSLDILEPQHNIIYIGGQPAGWKKSGQKGVHVEFSKSIPLLLDFVNNNQKGMKH
jgi:hypothetical protein